MQRPFAALRVTGTDFVNLIWLHDTSARNSLLTF